MRKPVASFIFLLSLSLQSTFAVSQDFIWLESSEGLESVDLSVGHPKTPGTSWSYAVDCSEQTVLGATDGSAKLFSCIVAQAEGDLKIELTKGNVGSGAILVVAIGRDPSGNITTESYQFTVKVVSKPLAYVEECADWDCPLYKGLYAGVEGTSVGEINDTTNIRVQYDAYSMFKKIHVFGRLSQSSLQEQAFGDSNCSEDQNEECEIESTIGGRLGVFWEAFGERSDAVISGPYIDYQIQKLGSGESFVRRYYAGYRFANSKVRYFSVGLGRTEHLPGNRVDITGQFPLYNQKVFAGMTINLAADSEAQEGSGDSINIYVMTKVDFTGIFSNF